MKLSDFALHSFDTVRYSDCDPQGHVNNVVFTTFMETGRCGLLAAGFGTSWQESGSFIVIARLELDFVAEIFWPGRVEIGSSVTKLGNSSMQIEQAVFQDDRLVAKAKSVLVHLGEGKRPASLPDAVRGKLTALLRPCA